MKASRQTNKRVIKVPIECRGGIGSSMREQKSTRRTTRHSHKATGKGGNFLVEKDECLSPYSAADGMCLELPDRGVQSSETTKRLPVIDFCQGQTLLPHSKIKLQLFPVNEVTRIGLEKDGHHPYLELILRARKKISSVLKHLNGKWGSSSVSLGEPALFPYKIQDSMSSNIRWTLNDGDISAGAIYAAIGSPEVFRLRYGWFSTEPKTAAEPSTSAIDKVDLQSEGAQRYSRAATENSYDKVGKHTGLPRKDFRSINASETINADTEKISTGAVHLKGDSQRMDGNHAQSPLLVDSVSIEGLLSEASLQAKCNNSDKKQIGKDEGFHPTELKSDSKLYALWADCPSISIGGLLSEASLQGKLNRIDAQSTASNAGLPPTHLISDSHQGFVATRINSPRGPGPSTHDSCLSILDAEETCHAFPFQKFSSSGKDVLGFGGSCGGFSQNAASKAFKSPNATKQVNSVAGLPQDRACQESDTDLMACSRVNDERSLGLSGIKWTDSLGPFDLGLPVSQKLITGESTSISGFVK
ncbi:PREDICTED: TSL-kinase interacting [Prunus dulcis]|uniref:PREDICTED: TSL-kinase interacting n=1 Tax=Prunus dulcis TaxID=3755 RepID=A0A5E4GK40_PRUDU|nr:TSL-kinase interacting protein 1-like isoform X1 [Prunus dulcis]XP_034197499.1 TSL-kinase interacting protein 1-like isoform X1 [Prunus dulcis]VVA40100.1 PREDICTED: TSL-kinase interacting [Prunus dulcis]